MTWSRIALLCSLLGAVQIALTLYASHASPRLYPEERVLRYFSADYLRRAADYRAARLLGQRVLVPAEIALPLLFVFGGPLLWLARRVAPLHPVLQGALLLGAFVLFTALLALPLQYRYGYLLERRFGFSNQRPLGYLLDFAKGLGIGLLLAVLVSALCVFLYRALPRAWPYLIFSSLSALTVFLVVIFPWVVEPLFYDFRELPAGPLRARIEQLAITSGVRVQRILEMKASEKTNRTNAYVSGLFGSHRVVLFDTLLARHTPDEVVSVVGHELGHSAKDHVALGVVLSILSIGLGVAGTVFMLATLRRLLPLPLPEGNPAPLLPVLLIVFSLVGFYASPLGSYLSRRMEAQADRYALDVTRDPRAAIAMEKKLTEDNLGDPNPRRLGYLWFASHPDPISRIRAAETWPQE